MPIGAINNNIFHQNSYANQAASSQRATADNKTEPISKKELGTESEISKLTSDIEKEESKLSELQKEMAQHISNGEKDQADLKSVEIQQKQMSVSLMNAKIKELSSSKTEQSSSYKEPRDEYIPSGDKPESSAGVYRLEKDEDGKQRIVFDQPDEAEKANEQARASAEPVENTEPSKEVKDPKENHDEEENSCTVNTDSIDREIKQLKGKKQQLEQQLNSVQGDNNKREELEKQLTQLDAELSMKDYDSYRKQHSTYIS